MSGPNSDYDPVEVAPLKAEEVEAMREAALVAIASAADLDRLKQVRLAHAGDRSPLALANREIGALPPAGPQGGRPAGRPGPRRGQPGAGRAAPRCSRPSTRSGCSSRRPSTSRCLSTGSPRGARHPITTGSELIADVFVAMGWEVAEGPVVEAEWLNFDALNLGADHPARTMQDTFWVEPAEHHLVLRTHTSPVQARTMLTRTPPIYVVCPGRVFRTDEYDATHSPMFHQVEGLVVDEGITMAHLKGVARPLRHRRCSARASTPGSGRRTSRSPSPPPRSTCAASSAAARDGEVESCRTCRGEGWIEWGGCGVVNPRVLVACGIDPERYTGFAFGMGIDRTLMFRHGITDMRDIFEGDVRFAAAFGTDI